ncbi:hypothetical protein HaLaN_08624 [Haematococcus lacustris]|uniref:Uncharacterized protein n=1 Tax=Haematococcus lacustris TaxID=44745 RepID=A0A699Z1J8_HAELA|nr:hypothetical protein HaLaN_08624 [Haematococcus lacustris]
MVLSRVADLEAQLQLAQRDLQAAKEPAAAGAEPAELLSAAQEQVGPRLQQLLEECGCQVKPGSEGEEGAGQPTAGLVQQLQALQGLLQAPGLRLGAEELQCLLANSDAKLAQLKA